MDRAELPPPRDARILKRVAPDDAHTQHSSRLQSGELSAEVSRAIVQLYKECYGKGPTKAHTYLGGNLVVCVLEGGFVKAEQTLVAAGRADVVHEQREAFQDTQRERFIGTIEQLTGRRVVTFISGVDVQTETNAELFVLDAADPDMGDEREAVSAWAEQTRRHARDLRDEAVRTRHEQAARRER